MTPRCALELKWIRRIALALAVALPNLAVAGLLNALAAEPIGEPARKAASAPVTLTYTVGSAPVGIAFDGTNLWVANSGDGTVSVLRASDGFHVFTPTVGTSPGVGSRATSSNDTAAIVNACR